MRERILIGEHDVRLRDSISLHLSLEGFTCDAVADGPSVLERAATDRFDLIVMDMALPPAGAVDVSTALRARRPHRFVPIVLTTAAASEPEALDALERCVDDYVVKPLGIRELVARVRALIRRANGTLSDAPTGPAVRPSLVRQRLVIDPARRRVAADGRPIKLTEQEFQLLYVLAEREGVVFDRDTLLSHIWGEHTFVTVRSVDALVKRVRKSLKTTNRNLEYLVTVRGVGYKFDASRTREPA